MAGKISGEGRVTYPDGSVYEGQFREDLAHGKGTITMPEGFTYTGQWAGGRSEERRVGKECRARWSAYD